MKYEQFNKNGWLISLIFIVLCGLFVQWPYMNEFPSFIHAWSQADRYALAIGFLNNGFDLFHPETLIYNKQFPGLWRVAYDTTITSVDFPILEYVVAVVMKITGITSPWIFRSCMLMVAFVGMFFLYKLAFIVTKDWLKSILAVAVAMTSPVYAYYYNGFIPGVPAFTFAVVALYFYLKYLNDNNVKPFYLSMLFMTLSVLIRMSFAVIWVAMLGFEFLRILRKETKIIDKLLPVSLSMIVFAAYYLWNKHLASAYGTLFLGDLVPANSWDDFWDRMSRANETWKYHYFSKSNYWLFVTAMLSAVAYVIYRKIKGEGKKEREKRLSLWLLVGTMIFGDMLFTIAMAKQFPDHDYYFIDTYFLPLLMLFVLVLKSLPEIVSRRQKIAYLVISFVFIVFMLDGVKDMQKYRRQLWWGESTLRTMENYRGSDVYLDSIGVSRDAKILTLWAYPQNSPFILMNRSGYTEMWYEKDIIEAGMFFPFDYVVIENELLYEREKAAWKGVFDRLEYFSDNGKIMVFVKKDE